MELTTNMVGVDKVSAGMDAMAERCRNLSKAIGKLGLWHQRKARRILRSGERGIQARNPAGLAASITFAQPSKNELIVGSNKSYAASQQFGPAGGYYTPVKGKYLAIPVLDNIVSRGNPRYNSPRDVKDGFFFRDYRNRLFFARRLKKAKKIREHRRQTWGTSITSPTGDDQIEVLFLLVPQAKGTAHHYVTHDKEDQAAWDRFAASWILKGN